MSQRIVEQAKVLSNVSSLSIPWNDGTDDVVTVVPSRDILNKSVALSWTDNLTSYTRTMHLTFDLTSPPSGFTPSVLTFTQEGVVITGTASNKYVHVYSDNPSTQVAKFTVSYPNFLAHVDTLSASIYDLGTTFVGHEPALADSGYWVSVGAITYVESSTAGVWDVSVALTLNKPTTPPGIDHLARVALCYGKAVGFYGISATFSE